MLIAEISQNFNNLDEAKKLVRLAKKNGGDLVKAQLFDSMKLYGKHTPSELSFDQAKMLFNYGKEIGIEVFFSVFDVERVGWCEEMGVKRYKIAYSQRNNKSLIREVRATYKPYFYSCSELNPYPSSNALYCVPNYPTELKDIHFRWGLFASFAGFSDHTIGLDIAKIALACRAEIIEKHFCLTHQMGVDAEWSMTPAELQELKRWELTCKEVL